MKATGVIVAFISYILKYEVFDEFNFKSITYYEKINCYH